MVKSELLKKRLRTDVAVAYQSWKVSRKYPKEVYKRISKKESQEEGGWSRHRSINSQFVDSLILNTTVCEQAH